MVPLVRIGLTTPPLPRVCSTTEPQRHKEQRYYYPIFMYLSSKFFMKSCFFNRKEQD